MDDDFLKYNSSTSSFKGEAEENPEMITLPIVESSLDSSITGLQSKNSSMVESTQTMTAILESSENLIKAESDIYNKIREQICFYFCDSNLHYDRYMRELIGINEVIDDDDNEDDHKSKTTNNGNKPVLLKEFLTFNKIIELTKSLDFLVKALTNADEYLLKNNLIFDAQKLTLRRCKPFNYADNDPTSRTIYLEGLDPQKDIANDIKNCLSLFGKVNTIRLPQKHNGPGFVFVEFAEEEDRNKCYEFLKKLFLNIECPCSSEREETIRLALLNLKHVECQLSVLTKSAWNLSRNYYLRKKRSCKRNYEQMKQNFILKPPMCPSGHICKECQMDVKKANEMEKINAKRICKNEPMYILRFEVSIPIKSELNYFWMRKTMRKIFKNGCQSSEELYIPNFHVVYIDTSFSNAIFEANAIKQTVFIQFSHSEHAEKLASNKWRTYLETNFATKGIGKILAIEQLSEQEVSEYWQDIHNKKCKKKEQGIEERLCS